MSEIVDPFDVGVAPEEEVGTTSLPGGVSSEYSKLDAEGIPLEAEVGKAKIETRHKRKRRKGVGKQAVTGSAPNLSEPVRPSACPRWMHHRKGTFCKMCGKMP